MPVCLPHTCGLVLVLFSGRTFSLTLSHGFSPRHPLFGALKGLLRVMPGTDLTKPADPTWGEK